ncbi:hypothetical protein [Janthinobacterium sp. UMAB-60]|uniref:hypothetical protein n=1 Tax=Janthinobacterium sp. UMAB-60 TaxID=1365365 RepID=UPI001C562873|nr:hypothetical protein [Janthinobacterium sp. UMAB-60]
MEVIGYLGNYHRRFRTKMVRKFGFEGFLLHCGANLPAGRRGKTGSGLVGLSTEKQALRNDMHTRAERFCGKASLLRVAWNTNGYSPLLVFHLPECMFLRIAYLLKD